MDSGHVTLEERGGGARGQPDTYGPLIDELFLDWELYMVEKGIGRGQNIHRFQCMKGGGGGGINEIKWRVQLFPLVLSHPFFYFFFLIFLTRK